MRRSWRRFRSGRGWVDIAALASANNTPLSRSSTLQIDYESISRTSLKHLPV